MAPRIILSSGPLHRQDAIVIDCENRVFWRGLHSRASTKSRNIYWFRFTSALLLNSPYLVSRHDLTDHVWGDREDGGSDNPSVAFSVHLSKQRDLYDWLGGRVITSWGRGCRFEFHQRDEQREAAE